MRLREQYYEALTGFLTLNPLFTELVTPSLVKSRYDE